MICGVSDRLSNQNYPESSYLSDIADHGGGNSTNHETINQLSDEENQVRCSDKLDSNGDERDDESTGEDVLSTDPVCEFGRDERRDDGPGKKVLVTE